MNNELFSSQSEGASQVPSISLSAQNDIALIKACQQRHQEAFALLVRKHQRRLFALAWHILQDDEQARTITQNTFLAAWEALPSLPTETNNISLWLFHLMCQRCLHQRRQQTSEPGRNAKKDMAQQQESHQMQAGSVAEYLPHLPTIIRVVVILHYVQGLSYEEIAQVLTLPIRTVKTHLFGARNLLKELLQTQHLSGPSF
jgi:RNA polymerase sigma-70 factor, ECF subfamily